MHILIEQGTDKRAREGVVIIAEVAHTQRESGEQLHRRESLWKGRIFVLCQQLVGFFVEGFFELSLHTTLRRDGTPKVFARAVDSVFKSLFELLHGGGACVGVFGEDAVHEVLQLGRKVYVGTQLVELWWLCVNVIHQDLGEVFTEKGGLSCECFKEDDPESVDVGAMIELFLSTRLFWRHIGGGAEEHACCGELCDFIRGQLGDPEVDDFDLFEGMDVVVS